MSRRGRVLRIRPGQNPNSSGHGILWGALFFLPQPVSGVLAAFFAEKLSSLLKADHAEREWQRFVTGLIWSIAWLGFFWLWLRFVGGIALWNEAQQDKLLLGVGTATAIVLGGFASIRSPGAKALWTPTWYAMLAAIPAALIGLVALPGLMMEQPAWGTLALVGAPTVYALIYLTLRNPRYGWMHLLIYMAGVLILLMPILPMAGTYNPVSRLFPVWGLGYPWLLGLYNLWKWNKVG